MRRATSFALILAAGLVCLAAVAPPALARRSRGSGGMRSGRGGFGVSSHRGGHRFSRHGSRFRRGFGHHGYGHYGFGYPVFFGYYGPSYHYGGYPFSSVYFNYRYVRPSRSRDRDYDRRSKRARAGRNLRLEEVGRDRVKLAWVEEGADITRVEFYTTRKDKDILDRLTVKESPYAVTLPIPPPDGFVGVTVKYADGSEVTKRLTLKKALAR